MDRPLGLTELTEKNLIEAVIYDSDGEAIGRVSHMHGSGANTQVVIDVGGFLGIGARPIALSTNELNWKRDEDGDVYAMTSWTKDEIKALPEHHT